MAAEVDPWLQYTRQEEVLARSKYSLVETTMFTTTTTTTKPKLEQVLQSQERILQRSLTTLKVVGNYKDILKWQVLPKNKIASQRPFELLRDQTVIQYSQTFIQLLYYIIRIAPESKDNKIKTKTRAMFLVTQLIEVQNIQEVVAVVVVVEADDSQLDTTLIGLILSLLIQETSQLPLYKSPVIYYLTIRGIDTQIGTFYPSFQYTLYLAYIVQMIRLLMLEVAVSKQGQPKLGLQSRKEIRVVAGAVVDQVYILQKNHLYEGLFSPALSILSQLAFGQNQNWIQLSKANIYQSDDRQTVFYDSKVVGVAKVRTMYYILTVELKGLLYKLLFRQSITLVLLLQLVDSIGTVQWFQQKRYSFVDYPDNARQKVSQEFLQEQILIGDQKLVRTSSSSSSSSQLEQAELLYKVYLAQEKQFLLKLIVAIHVIEEQPTYSPKISSIKVQNSIILSRNVFVINRRVVVVTTYNKAQKRRGKSKYMFRYFLDQLSQVITQYLVYVLLFLCIVKRTKGDFLFTTKREPQIQDQLSRVVVVAITKYLRVQLIVLSQRYITITIADKYLRKVSRIQKQAQEEDRKGEVVEEESDSEVEQSLFKYILVQQLAHSKQTIVQYYIVDSVFLNQLRPDLMSVYSQVSQVQYTFLYLELRGVVVAMVVKYSASLLL